MGQLHRKVSSVTGAVVTMSPMCISPTLDSASSPSISPSLLAQQTAILDPCPGVAAGLGEKSLSASQLVSALFDAADVSNAGYLPEKEGRHYLDAIGCPGMAGGLPSNDPTRISKAEFVAYVLRQEEVDGNGRFIHSHRHEGIAAQLRVLTQSTEFEAELEALMEPLEQEQRQDEGQPNGERENSVTAEAGVLAQVEPVLQSRSLSPNSDKDKTQQASPGKGAKQASSPEIDVAAILERREAMEAKLQKKYGKKLSRKVKGKRGS